MNLVRLYHVQITVPIGAEEQARAFYCGLLNLVEISKPASLEGRGRFWLELGGQEIHLGMEDGFDRFSTRAHLAYQVENLTVWRVKLQRVEYKILEGLPLPGFERFETRDPFGNRLELIEKLSYTTQEQPHSSAKLAGKVRRFMPSRR